jgi:hypothetical protein
VNDVTVKVTIEMDDEDVQVLSGGMVFGVIEEKITKEETKAAAFMSGELSPLKIIKSIECLANAAAQILIKEDIPANVAAEGIAMAVAEGVSDAIRVATMDKGWFSGKAGTNKKDPETALKILDKLIELTKAMDALKKNKKEDTDDDSLSALADKLLKRQR